MSDKALDGMMAELGSKDPFIRQQMAVQLGHLGDRGAKALPVLKKMLQDPDPKVREAAKEAIGLLTD